MVCPLWGEPGGIQALLSLSQEQWRAIEADLLTCGFVRSQIGTRELPWSAVMGMVQHSRHGSALWTAIHGDAGRWSELEHIAAVIADYVALNAWLSSDTTKTKRPLPLQRPGEAKKQGESFGSALTAVPMDEFWDLWNDNEDDGAVSDAS